MTCFLKQSSWRQISTQQNVMKKRKFFQKKSVKKWKEFALKFWKSEQDRWRTGLTKRDRSWNFKWDLSLKLLNSSNRILKNQKCLQNLKLAKFLKELRRNNKRRKSQHKKSPFSLKDQKQFSGMKKNQWSGMKKNQWSGMKKDQRSGMKKNQWSGMKKDQRSGMKKNQWSQKMKKNDFELNFKFLFHRISFFQQKIRHFSSKNLRKKI